MVRTCLIVAVGLVAMGVLGSPVCYGLVVDDFEVGPFSLTATEFGLDVDSMELDQAGLPTGNVIGGRRSALWDLIQPESDVIPPVVTVGVSDTGGDGALTLTGNSKAIGHLEMGWGGFGPDVDLTVGGDHDRFLVKVSGVTTEMRVEFLVRTRSLGAGQLVGVSRGIVFVSEPGMAEFRYSVFTDSFGSGADFTEVDTIQLSVSNVIPTGGPWEFQISEIVTGVPEPGSIAVLLVGGGLIICRGRQKRSRGQGRMLI